MLYGTPTPAAHRATAGGALAIFVRGVGQTGQHRSPIRRPEPQRSAHLLVQGLAAVIVLGLTTLIGLFIVANAQRGNPFATLSDSGSALASRALDAEPLTLNEVFPDRGTVRTPATYQIAQTHQDADCRTATVGVLGAVLAEHGCNQVVRAGLTAPYGDYEVTAGVFNLADAADADAVEEQLRRLVETGDGNVATLPASDGRGLPTVQVGWRAHGHYLLYCVITRPDGRLVTGDDPNAARITADLVDAYLGGNVLDRRTS